MTRVIIESVSWWICTLVEFSECCDYVDWCICTLVDFVDGCEWLNYVLIACLTCLYLYTWWINLMLIILVINDEVRIVYVYIWFGDSFDNDDCLFITLKWWIILIELSTLNEE